MMIACRNLGQPTVNSPIPCLTLYYQPYTTSLLKKSKDLRLYADLLTLWIPRSKTSALRSRIYSISSPTCRIRRPKHRRSNCTCKPSRQDHQTRTLFPLSCTRATLSKSRKSFKIEKDHSQGQLTVCS